MCTDLNTCVDYFMYISAATEAGRPRNGLVTDNESQSHDDEQRHGWRYERYGGPRDGYHQLCDGRADNVSDQYIALHADGVEVVNNNVLYWGLFRYALNLPQ